MTDNPASIQIIFRYLARIDGMISLEYPNIAEKKVDILLNKKEEEEYNKIVIALINNIESIIKNKGNSKWWDENVVDPLKSFLTTNYLRRSNSSVCKYNYLRFAYKNVIDLMQKNNIKQDLAA